MDKLTKANRAVARAVWLERKLRSKARNHANAGSFKAEFYSKRYLKAWELTVERTLRRNALVPDGCAIDTSFLIDMPEKFRRMGLK